MAVAAFSLQILEAGDYDAVRSFIDTSLDSAALPDTLIDLYGPLAESEVLARDPDALTFREGEVTEDAVKWTRIRRAAILLTGARLCGAVPALISEQVGADRYQRTPFDPAKRAAELRGLASQEMAAYLNEDGLTEPLFAFTTACGRRGR